MLIKIQPGCVPHDMITKACILLFSQYILNIMLAKHKCSQARRLFSVVSSPLPYKHKYVANRQSRHARHLNRVPALNKHAQFQKLFHVQPLLKSAALTTNQELKQSGCSLLPRQQLKYNHPLSFTLTYTNRVIYPYSEIPL